MFTIDFEIIEKKNIFRHFIYIIEILRMILNLLRLIILIQKHRDKKYIYIYIYIGWTKYTIQRGYLLE